MLLFFISFFVFSLNSPVLLSYSYIIPRYTLSKLLRLLVHCLTQLLCLALIVVVVVVGWPFRFSSCAVLGSSLCLSCCCRCCCYKPSHIYLYKGKMLLATAVGWLEELVSRYPHNNNNTNKIQRHQSSPFLRVVLHLLLYIHRIILQRPRRRRTPTKEHNHLTTRSTNELGPGLQ